MVYCSIEQRRVCGRDANEVGGQYRCSLCNSLTINCYCTRVEDYPSTVDPEGQAIPWKPWHYVTEAT